MVRWLNAIDSYKLGHRPDYPTGTQRVYCNFTPRSSRVEGVKHVCAVGAQHLIREYMVRLARDTFFSMRVNDVIEQHKRMVDRHIGPNTLGTEHIRALHQYGKLPLQFWGVPEGSHIPIRMPTLTWENTHPDFFWLPNYIEDMVSSVMWPGHTSATTAYCFYRLLKEAAIATGGDPTFVPWQGHDFSSRGLMTPHAAAISGLGHLSCFTGTDTIVAVDAMWDDYGGGAAGSVPATEHSVMCAGGEDTEFATFERLLDNHPTGVLSIVSDTWDFWRVITEYLPRLKERIMARDGKLVIRPDSGDPVKIICGDPDAVCGSAQHVGLIQCLWSIFGGSRNAATYRELDPHIGAIFGDAITYDRAESICQKLKRDNFASTNIVLGIGSYTYQYVTRDTYGIAIKATWAMIDGKEHMLCKTPKTGDGTTDKRSARGRIALLSEGGARLRMVDGLDLEAHRALDHANWLQPLWLEGRWQNFDTWSPIRDRAQRGPLR